MNQLQLTEAKRIIEEMLVSKGVASVLIAYRTDNNPDGYSLDYLPKSIAARDFKDATLNGSVLEFVGLEDERVSESFVKYQVSVEGITDIDLEFLTTTDYASLDFVIKEDGSSQAYDTAALFTNRFAPSPMEFIALQMKVSDYIKNRLLG